MGAFDGLDVVPSSAAPDATPKGSAFDGLEVTPSGPPPPEPDMSPAKKVLESNLAEAKAIPSPNKNPAQHDPHPAQSFLDDWLAGWQQSTTALGITRKSLPDTVLPENAGTMARILSMAGTFAGDIPAAVAGMVGGGVAGAAAGGVAGSPLGGIPGAAVGAGVGTAIGSTAGAFALPAAIRQVLMDHYKKGDIQNFSDFYERASGAFLASLKSGTVGAASAVAGLATGGILPAAVSPLLKLGATTAAEGSVMTTVGAAMDGKTPKLQDFADNAAFMVALHGLRSGVESSTSVVEPVKNKLMDIYSKTGLDPHQVTQMAANDPVLRQQIISKDNSVPDNLKPAVDPKAQPDPHSVTIQPDLVLKKNAEGLASYKTDVPESELKVEPLADKDNPTISKEPGEPKQRSAAVNAILSRIGEQPDAPKEKLSFDKMYYNILDDKDPLKNMTKSLLGEGALGTKDDPYGLARSFGSVARKADEIIENGTRDYSTLQKTGTPGLSAIWDKAEDLKELRAYQIAKHSLDLENSGVQTGVDLNAAKAAVRELGPKYKDIAKENVKFNNDNIDYLVKSGVLASDKAKIMKDKYQNYSAMNRVMGTDEASGSGGSGSGMIPYNPIKSIEGSDRQIIDPLQSNIKNTHQIIEMAERNRVMRAVTDLIDSQIEKGDTSWGTKAKTPMMAIDVKGEEIAKELVKQGLTPDEAMNLNDVATIFRADRQPLADDQIASYKDGKRQVYENVPQGILDAVKGMSKQDVNSLTKMLSPPSKLLREGMMVSPAFGIRHFFRQETLAASLSKDMHLPVYETVKGMAGMMGDKEAFGDWIMHGGAGDSIGAIDNDYIKSKIYDLNEQTGFMDNAWNKVKNGLQFTKHAIELTDEARTFQKYRNRLASGEVQDRWQAQFEARDTGIDVQRSGAAMAAYSRLDPFQNIRVQGLDLIARRIGTDPKTVVPKLLASITLPSILLWSQNHDKEWYKELTSQDRDTNWHFAVGDPDNGGHVIRVPKPFEPGVVFGALPERIMDAYFTDNPHALKGFMKTVTDAMAPGYVPTFAQPIIEAFANKSMLTGSPLIAKNMENVPPQMQSNPYTSDAAKIIAGGLRQIPLGITQNPGSLGSPIIVDNFIRNWTGGAGQLVLSATDAVLEKSGIADAIGIDYNHNPPAKVWSDNPFLRSFVVRYPSTNTAAIGDFFDRFNKTQTELNGIQFLKQKGDYVGAFKEMQLAAQSGTMVKLTGYKQTLSEGMNMIQKITVMPGMDPTQKRQAIDQWAIAVNKAATQANQMMDQMDENFQQMKKTVGNK